MDTHTYTITTIINALLVASLSNKLPREIRLVSNSLRPACLPLHLNAGIEDYASTSGLNVFFLNKSYRTKLGSGGTDL